MRTILWVSILALAAGLALAGSAAAQEEEFACPDTPDQVTVCFHEEADDGDPNCEEEGNYYATTRGSVATDVQGVRSEAKFSGTEACRHSTGWFSYHDGYESFSTSLKVCSGAECQQIGLRWAERWDNGEYEDPDCTMQVWVSLVGVYEELNLQDTEDESECLAGSPPNPGWGEVYP